MNRLMEPRDRYDVPIFAALERSIWPRLLGFPVCVVQTDPHRCRRKLNSLWGVLGRKYTC